MTTTDDFRTLLARAGVDADRAHGAVMPPIHLSSTFTFEGLGAPRRYDYTRSGNPTRTVLADAIAALEGGAGAVVTSTGMSAIATVLQRVPGGGHVVASNDTYGGTRRLLDAWARRGRFRLTLVDPREEDGWARALSGGADVAWIETPSNPLLRITDMAAVAARAHAAGACVVVDNTFLTPLLQRPIELGADVVVHSTTKYLNGHSDVVGGAIVARRREDVDDLAWWANATGTTGAPFDAWLTLRGLRTLALRMRAHEENAFAVARLLRTHEAVSRVHYPGLVDHPGHDVARRQQSGFGAIVTFELVSGRDAVGRFVAGLSCFSLAESLGGVESLVAHPATMTHACLSPEARAAAGIGDGLVRLSVGIESADDLLADLRAALSRARVGTVVGVVGV